MATLLSSLIACQWVVLQTLWQFLLKDLSIDELVCAWCFGCCRAYQGLPVGFLLLQHSVLFTVESSSLLYLLVISWFIYFRRWCIDKLGTFHANHYPCVFIHIWTKGEVCAPLNRIKPSSKIFKLTVPRRYFFYGSFVLFMFCVCVLIHIWTKCEDYAPWNRFKLSSKTFYWPFKGGASFVDRLCYFCLFCYAFMHVCLLMPCDHLLRKGLPLGSRLWCLIVTLSLST